MYSAERERLEKLAIEELKKLQKLKKERIIKKKKTETERIEEIAMEILNKQRIKKISQPLKY